MEKCKDCWEILEPLNPPCEEYLEHKFCIKIFGYKLMLIRDVINYGCKSCIQEKEDARLSEIYNSGGRDAINDLREQGYEF